MVAQPIWIGLYAALIMETSMSIHLDAERDVRRNKNLVDFGSVESKPWMIINDTVMGGVSRSALEKSDSTAVFSGKLSLENGGGFVSMRTIVIEDLSEYAGMEIRVKGDGKVYQLRLRTDRRFDWIAYRAHFETQPGTWSVVRIPFSEFEPTYRGRVLSDMPDLDPTLIRQVGFLLADAQEGDFRLEVAWVRAYG